MTSKRQIHLAAHFPGVNNTTVWSDPASGSHIDFASFVHLAQTAERAKFDFFFLAEGLSVREHAGHVHDLDVVGRPESFTILAALAAVTERIGLMATLTATYHEPYELARALGTLDHLSGGRAGWNLVTSTDALTGRNFSRGGYLDYGDRYVRGRELGSEFGCLSHGVLQPLSLCQELILTGVQLGQLLGKLTLGVL